MKLARFLLICLILALCAACSSLGSIRQKSYLSAESIPPLKIPPGMASNSFRNDYPVSGRDYPGNKDISLIPPGLDNN